MVNSGERNTESLILEAARRVFARKGLEGARMQEIAEEAGINKALLHYYFRSKEKLFELIFREAFGTFVKDINELLVSDLPVLEKIRHFIGSYMDMLFNNPGLPAFILAEIHHNPQRLLSFVQSQGLKHEIFQEQIRTAAQAGVIRSIDPKHLLINIIGLCVFPFIAKPIIIGFLFNDQDAGYERFMNERKEEVYHFLLAGLEIRNSQ